MYIWKISEPSFCLVIRNISEYPMCVWELTWISVSVNSLILKSDDTNSLLILFLNQFLKITFIMCTARVSAYQLIEHRMIRWLMNKKGYERSGRCLIWGTNPASARRDNPSHDSRCLCWNLNSGPTEYEPLHHERLWERLLFLFNVAEAFAYSTEPSDRQGNSTVQYTNKCAPKLCG
jgi:hypothetical protein